MREFLNGESLRIIGLRREDTAPYADQFYDRLVRSQSRVFTKFSWRSSGSPGQEARHQRGLRCGNRINTEPYSAHIAPRMSKSAHSNPPIPLKEYDVKKNPQTINTTTAKLHNGNTNSKIRTNARKIQTKPIRLKRLTREIISCWSNGTISKCNG